MSAPFVPDRRVPRLPPITTLEALEREHKRLKELRDAGIPEARKSPEEWSEQLAKALRPWSLIRGGRK